MIKKYLFIIIIILILIFSQINGYTNFNPESILKYAKTIVKNDQAFLLINIKKGTLVGIINKNIALEQTFIPGSTFKLVTAISALKKNKNLIHYKIYCNDRYYIFGKHQHQRHIFFNSKTFRLGDYFRCSRLDGHKNINFHQAIKKSCNIYFWKLGNEIGYQNWYQTAANFGFGKKVFQDYPTENPGMLHYEKNHHARQLLAYIGDGGSIQVTPIQMAQFIYFFAQNGLADRLTYIEKNNSYRSSPLKMIREYQAIIPIVKKGLIVVYQKSSRNSDSNFAGKTGSGSRNSSIKTNGWFMGYAPINNPKIAFVFFMKKGNGKIAQYLAKKIIFQIPG